MANHSKKKSIKFTKSRRDPKSTLESIDREIAFYRRRAGQVFFFGLLAEAVILVGRQKVFFSDIFGEPEKAIVYAIFFFAVAVVGTFLGSEYRRRLHILKDSRIEVIEEIGYKNVFPSSIDRIFSEIIVLYIVLWFISLSGIIIVWLSIHPNRCFVIGYAVLVVVASIFYFMGKIIQKKIRSAKSQNK